MTELTASPFFGIALSILAYWVGVRLQKKTGLVVCNPLIIAIVLVSGGLLLFPIAVSISGSLGGMPSITVVAVILTGILGSVLSPFLIKLFRVKDPVAAGLAIGACSHAVGTARALELGETQGAMSGLAIGICGIVTVLIATLLF